MIDEIIRGWSASRGILQIVRICAFRCAIDMVDSEIGSGLSGGGSGSAGGDGMVVRVAAAVVHEDELHCRGWIGR